MEAKELKRIHRVIDMMRTMHSLMRDRYRRLSLLVDLIILAGSVILCATVFLDPNILDQLGIKPESSKIILGTTSILIFLFSLVQLKVNWKQKGEMFDKSVEILCTLKSECDTLLNMSTSPCEKDILNQCEACGETLAKLPKIPDRFFNKLKAKHKRKVKLSKYIDTRPESPYWLTRLLFESRSIFKKYNKNSQKEED